MFQENIADTLKHLHLQTPGAEGEILQHSLSLSGWDFIFPE